MGTLPPGTLYALELGRRGGDSPSICDSGVEAFDRLQKNQKLTLLDWVGVALRDEAVPCPDLTVNTEAAVAVVFRMIASEVLSEIDYADEPA